MSSCNLHPTGLEDRDLERLKEGIRLAEEETEVAEQRAIIAQCRALADRNQEHVAKVLSAVDDLHDVSPGHLALKELVTDLQMDTTDAQRKKRTAEYHMGFAGKYAWSPDGDTARLEPHPEVTTGRPLKVACYALLHEMNERHMLLQVAQQENAVLRFKVSQQASALQGKEREMAALRAQVQQAQRARGNGHGYNRQGPLVNLLD